MEAASNAVPPVPSARREGNAALWAGALAGAAGAALAFLPEAREVLRSEWMENARTVKPLAAFVIAAAGGFGAAYVSAAVETWPRRAGLLMAGIALAVTQSLFLSHRLATGWEPASLCAAMTLATLTAGWLARAPSGITRWFEGRLGSEAVARLAAAQSTEFLQPDQREAAVLTCRILNETRLRSQMPAREFLKVAEAFRLRSTRVLLQHGALLDATESGTVRAFFGLPLPVDNHADRAAAAALALTDELRQLSLDHMRKDCDHVEFGTGITCGVLTAGLTGEAYTAAGDAVDQSRWLAALNADYHSAILTDGETHRLAGFTEDRPLEILNPPEGAAVEVFQLLAKLGGLSQEALGRRNAFRDAITLLRAGHAGDALARFEDAAEGLASHDFVLERFVSLAREQAARDTAARRSPAPPVPPAPRQPKPNRKVPRP